MRLWALLSLVGVALACGGASERTEARGAGRGGTEAGGSSSGVGGTQSGGTGGTSGSTSELDGFCEWYGETWCAVANDPDTPSHHVDYCIRGATLDCLGIFVPRHAGAFREGRLEYHPEYLEACAEDWKRESPPDIHASCRAIFRGTVENGEPCHLPNALLIQANECANGYCSDDSCPGVCRPYLETGAACIYASNHCAPDHVCYEERCVPRPGEGDECDPDQSFCPNGLWCRPFEGRAPYRCLPKSPAGGACDEIGECIESACRDGVCRVLDRDEPCEVAFQCAPELSCIGGLCAPPLPANSGEMCSSSRDCQEGLVCTLLDTWIGCMPRSTTAIGDPCGMFAPYLPACPNGLVCVDDICVARGGPGESCPPVECSFGFVCDDGICRETVEGEPCNSETGCSSEFFCEDSVCVRRKPQGSPCSAGGECQGGCNLETGCAGGCNDY